eukprot:2484978-Rhodomonas_salina.1
MFINIITASASAASKSAATAAAARRLASSLISRSREQTRQAITASSRSILHGRGVGVEPAISVRHNPLDTLHSSRSLSSAAHTNPPLPSIARAALQATGSRVQHCERAASHSLGPARGLHPWS